MLLSSNHLRDLSEPNSNVNICLRKITVREESMDPLTSITAVTCGVEGLASWLSPCDDIAG